MKIKFLGNLRDFQPFVSELVEHICHHRFFALQMVGSPVPVLEAQTTYRASIAADNRGTGPHQALQGAGI